MIGKLSMRDFA